MDGQQTEVQAQNIAGSEVGKRKVFGLLAIATMAFLIPLRVVMPELPWVIALGFLGWSAALCLFQSRHGVCVIYAARGLRNLGSGIEPVASPKSLTQHRCTAQRVHLLAGASWGLTTTLAVAAVL